jgi:membrane associated rhomboid family serine protease
MRPRQFLTFASKVTAAHVITYLVAGTIAYPLFTKEFYVGPNPIFKLFMRTEAEPELWRHVAAWFLPAQFLEGVLIAAALYPFFDTLMRWSFSKRFLSISLLYIALGFWAATVAAPGTIEGMVYLRPIFTPLVHLKVQPEILVQGLALAAMVALWMGPPAIEPLSH